MNRRQFVQRTAIAAAATTAFPLSISSAADQKTKGIHWPIGAFNRPWAGDKKNWGYDAALDGMKAAGYRLTGLLTRTEKQPFTGADATEEYLADLKKKIAAHGLTAVMAALRTKDELPLDEQIKGMRKQIDNAKFVGVEFLLTFGVGKEEYYENYYKLMHDAAAYSQERGLKLVLKPHGGSSGDAEEITRCIEKVSHPNFKVWFDAGNIIYYTGKDPLEQLKPVVQYVTGFCAKDCDKQKGSVWLEFGTGKVDFPAVFGELKKAGFNGPVMVECCALGDTADIVTENMRNNREYLEKVFASL
jgi:Sugar phosphate isomerases/epimerases